MLVTIWHVRGQDFDVDSFVEQFNIKAPDIYRKGVKTHKGKVPDDSGLSILVSEELAADKHLKDIEEFIYNNKSALMNIKEKGYNSCLAMGCTVGTSDQFTKSVQLTSTQLGLLHDHGLSIEFSAYPAID